LTFYLIELHVKYVLEEWKTTQKNNILLHEVREWYFKVPCMLLDLMIVNNYVHKKFRLKIASVSLYCSAPEITVKMLNIKY